MKRSHFAALTFGLLLSVSATTGPAQFRGSLPLAAGDPFPEIDVHDADGAKLNTRSLKGKYTVIVNGCLT
jgi:cytochrome oxidase Cu insertion factor (SCO1/SenC/PrrC family)